MIKQLAILLVVAAAVVLTVTGFGWFGASTDDAQGWIGLAFLGLGLASADLDGRIARHRAG